MPKKKKKSKEEIGERVLKDIQENIAEDEMKDVLKNNKKVFELNGKFYRVRKPIYAEQCIINDYRMKKYAEFISKPHMKFREELIAIYKTKGKDIEKMQDEIQSLQNEIHRLQLRLATSQDPKDVKQLSSEIMSIRQKQYLLNRQKAELLSYSIEDQLALEINSFTTYLILETQKDDKWVRVFGKYEDFMNSDNIQLFSRASRFSNLLMFGV